MDLRLHQQYEDLWKVAHHLKKGWLTGEEETKAWGTIERAVKEDPNLPQDLTDATILCQLETRLGSLTLGNPDQNTLTPFGSTSNNCIKNGETSSGKRLVVRK